MSTVLFGGTSIRSSYQLRHYAMALLFFLAMMAASVYGRPVSQFEAATAAKNWLNAQNSLFEKRATASWTIKSTKSGVAQDGTTLYYIISTDNGVAVVTSAETGIEPVIAVVNYGEDGLDSDPENPLTKILIGDMTLRMGIVRKVLENAKIKSLQKGDGGALNEISTAEGAWASLLSPEPEKFGRTSISDVRVSPLVQSKWGQSRVASLACYNYYTPPYAAGSANNYVCGCVATAAAQVMRKWQYPTAYISQITRTCKVNGSSTTKTSRGGTFAWSSMPLVPSSGMSATQRSAIGHLCYDVGVSVGMNWTSDESGSSGYMLPDAFKDVFGYASANCRTHPNYGGANSSFTQSEIRNGIWASLDAGCPAVIGIYGHEVVADGYGYQSSTAYTHLNMGWSGSCDIWYNLPTVDATEQDYYSSALDEVVYNLNPYYSGDLLTGRVLNLSGQPVSGATVRAAYGSQIYTGTTNSKGVYAIWLTGGRTYSVTATSGSLTSTPRDVFVTQCVSESLSDNFGTGVIGNSWGNDLTVVPYVSNDHFSNALGISGVSGRTTGANVGATRESGEPTPSAQSNVGASVWWRWTAPSSGTYVFSTVGSTFDTVLAIYSGSSLTSLSQKSSDDDGGNNQTSICTFSATANTTYYIQVCGYNANTGSIALSWSQVAPELAFYCPSSEKHWPAAAFLANAENSTKSITSFAWGQPVYVNYAYANDGTASAGAHTVLIEVFNSSNTRIVSWPISRSTALGVDYYTWLNSNNAIDATLSPGSYRVVITLDSNNQVSEANENNNTYTLWFTVTSTSFTSSSVYRFYSRKFKGHFYTISESEKRKLETSDPNWKYETASYRAYTAQARGTVPLYRFYSSKFKGHFYTRSESEKNKVLQDRNWQYEGVAFYIYPSAVSGALPVHRFWSSKFKHHFYTMNESEMWKIRNTDRNWSYEAIAFYALPNSSRYVARAKSREATAKASALAGLSSAALDAEGVAIASGVRLETLSAGLPIEAGDMLVLGDLTLEARAEEPVDFMAGSPTPLGDAAPGLRLSLPENTLSPALWSAADGTLLEGEVGKDTFDFKLPASDVWHRLFIRDDADHEVWSLWLRALSGE